MSRLGAARPNAHHTPSFADTHRKLATPLIAFGSGRWDRIALGFRLSSSLHVPSAAVNVSVSVVRGNVGARLAKASSEPAVGIEVAVDHLHA